jgi:hypothetical protein
MPIAGENGKREFPTEASGTAGDQPRLHNFPRFGFRDERARLHDSSREVAILSAALSTHPAFVRCLSKK